MMMKILSVVVFALVMMACAGPQTEQPAAAPEAAPEADAVEIEADPVAQATEDGDAS